MERNGPLALTIRAAVSLALLGLFLLCAIACRASRLFPERQEAHPYFRRVGRGVLVFGG